MSKTYLEVGILGLCGILIAAIAWVSFKKNQEKLDEKDKIINKEKETIYNRLDQMTTNLQAQNQAFLEQQTKSIELLTSKLISNITTHVPSPEENAKLTKVSEDLNQLLQQILISTGASRVNIVQYHNGGHSLNKQSFLRMSMTNEQVQIGIKPFISNFKEQFRSVISYIIKELNDKGYCYIEDIEDIKELDYGTYEFLKQRDIQAKYCLAIHNKHNEVIGFLGIEYVNKQFANKESINRIFKEKQSLLEFLLSQ